MKTTISNDTDALTAVRFVIGGGKFRVRLRDRQGSRWQWGDVLDDTGAVIGSANTMVYSGEGWCIETAAYHGHAPLGQVVLVP